jgi:16S rRNA (cytidine1402-2'-O)-methyltransferase
MNTGIIYLIPSPISDTDPLEFLPPAILDIIPRLEIFYVENIRTTRRFLSKIGIRGIESLRFEVLDKDTSDDEIKSLLIPVLEGSSAGILSEAGCPGIADPGSVFIRSAHSAGIRVIPLPGPSSIFLALMASGFNGQNFVFHGYLPIDNTARSKKIKELELQSKKLNQTQIFMETPYRNRQLIRSLLTILNDTTRICIAADLTGNGEFVKTQKVVDWKKQIPDLHKKPAIYLLSYF